MKYALMTLAFVTACMVSAPPDQTEVTAAAEQALVDRVANTLGGAAASSVDDDTCRRLEGCVPSAHNTCCRTTQTSRCCNDVVLVPDSHFENFCYCAPLPHTDPGHGFPQDPFAP